MAEGGTKAGFGKVFQKKVIRTKEKFLQNLGKADKTTDETFQQHVNNFSDQQAILLRLQKELKHYMYCVKEMSTSSHSLYQTIKDAYEANWTGYCDVVSTFDQLAIMWDDYMVKLMDQINMPLVEYSAQFNDIKAKISKRGRKLTDYDVARHNLESLTTKHADSMKITRAEEELEGCKQIYETINVELYSELPALYGSRVGFLSSLFNSLFSTEVIFQRESAKLKDLLVDATDRLRSDDGSSNNSVKAASPPPLTSALSTSSSTRDKYQRRSESSSILGLADHQSDGSSTHEDNRTNANQYLPPPSTNDGTPPADYEYATINEVHRPPAAQLSYNNPNFSLPSTNLNLNESNTSPSHGPFYSAEPDSSSSSDSPRRNLHGSLTAGNRKRSPSPRGSPDSLSRSIDSPMLARDPPDVGNSNKDYELAGHIESSYSPPVPNKTFNSVDGRTILYRVKATHQYAADDEDELAFEIGEIIGVVPFDDPDDQDEGWLQGINETTGRIGLFPENFTCRL